MKKSLLYCLSLPARLGETPLFKNAFHALLTHPLNRGRRMAALRDYFGWQIGARVAPGRIVFEWLNGSKVIVGPHDYGFTGNVYFGLHDFREMSYLLHVLREGDTFVDIGANIGSYTILACAARGAWGYSFEPIPSTFERLDENLRINKLYARVQAFNLGLSDSEDHLEFTTNQDCTNHVTVDGDSGANTMQVKVRALDSLMHGINPTAMKLDVEGFEYRVLKGAEATLKNQSLHSVIMEMNAAGCRYGFSDNETMKIMFDHGFKMYNYEPFSKQLESTEPLRRGGQNVLFIRNESFVRELLIKAPRVNVNGRLL